VWLLDANMDVHLLSLLRELGVSCDAASRRGWAALENGDLTAAAAAGFRCILTQDKLFAESARAALAAVPEFSVVLVRLPQRRWREYGEQFRQAWQAIPIRPVPGHIIAWPVA
jgi:predicted nuclease of predicted toxin-antitoxin system